MGMYWKRIASLSLAFLLIPSASSAQVAGQTSQGGLDPDLLQKARAGDPAAQFRIATIYRNGEGVPKDQALSASWLRNSAEQGDP